MNTLDYAAELRAGAEYLLEDLETNWWFHKIIPSEQVYNWLSTLEVTPSGASPLEHMSNPEQAFCFLLIAEALEAGDLP